MQQNALQLLVYEYKIALTSLSFDFDRCIIFIVKQKNIILLLQNINYIHYSNCFVSPYNFFQFSMRKQKFCSKLKVGSHCSAIIPDSPWLWSVMITDRLWCLCSHCHNTSLMRHWCITEASLMYGAHCSHSPNHNHNSFDLYMYVWANILQHLRFKLHRWFLRQRFCFRS